MQLTDGTWVDITDWVRLENVVTVTRGRADEAQAVERSAASLKLENDGRFSSRNPTGPWYQRFGRNTPLRMSLPATPYLDMSGVGASVTAPDATPLHITGDIDIRIDLSMPNWRLPALDLCGKYQTSANQRGWAIRLEGDGRLFYQWSADGSSFAVVFATRALPAQPGRLALRVTHDVDDGAGGNIVTFYTAPTLAGPWTQLGDPVTSTGTTSIFASTAPIEIGDVAAVTTTPAPLLNPTRAVTGRCYGFELRAGIGGTVVANPDFTAQAPGTTWFGDTVAAAQNLWTLGNGAQVSDRRYRFWGEVSSWPPRWDLSGNDITVTVAAAGILQRLGQGDAPLKSVIRRGIDAVTDDSTVAYWPCEDEAGSTVIASALDGGKPMTISVATPSLASYEGFPGSKPLPLLSNSTWVGRVRGYAATGAAQVRFLLAIPSTGTTNNAVVIRVQTSGTAAFWELTYTTASAGGLTLRAYDRDASLLFASSTDSGYNGVPARWSIELDQNGADLDWVYGRTRLDSPHSFAGTSGTLNNQTVGAVTKISISPDPALQIDDTGVGHISVHNAITSLFDISDELTAYTGEPAARRFARLCTEEGIPYEIIGGVDALDALLGALDGDTSERMGPQRPLALLALLQECVDADLGMMYEPRHVFGLGYRTRSSLYSQTARLTVDHSSEQLGAPPEPDDDDQLARNDVTVSREGGSSARAIVTSGPLSALDPPDGVGRYDDAKTINVESDDQLPDQATWRAHLGTVDETRFPQVSVNLAATPELADDAEEAEVGDMLTIGGPLPGMAPDDSRQLIQGSSETMGHKTHEIVYNCAPASPYDVAVADDDRAEATDSELAAPVDATATTLSVATATGPLWTTAAADMPFDSAIGGEVMTVSAVSGSSSPQTFTVTRSANGVTKSHAAGEAVALASPVYAGL